jgi:hypothetical protein
VVLTDPELRARFDAGDDPNDPTGGNPFAQGAGGHPFGQFFSGGGFGGGGFGGFHDGGSGFQDGSIKSVLFIAFNVYLYLHGTPRSNSDFILIRRSGQTSLGKICRPVLFYDISQNGNDKPV